MNPEKFTQKSLEAIRAASALASEKGNPTLEPCHILSALLSAEGGLIPEIITNMGADVKRLSEGVGTLVASLPTGSSGEPYLSREGEAALTAADRGSGRVIGIEKTVRRFCVTSSPITPSPRVAP